MARNAPKRSVVRHNRRAAMPELTQDRLKELLYYDSETGVFTRKVTTSSRGIAGQVVGSANASGTVYIRVDGLKRGAARLAWLYQYGVLPDVRVGHRNGDKADNRIVNLRVMDGRKTKLTQSRLIELMHYNKDTGQFTRLVTGGSTKAGSHVGGKRNNGYICIAVDGFVYQAHRLAFLYMKAAMPEQVDHINHVRDDNRWSNLRAATATTNAQNRSQRSDNKSGVTGVFYELGKCKWRARVMTGGKTIDLGHFDTLQAATKARLRAEIKYGFHPNHGK